MSVLLLSEDDLRRVLREELARALAVPRGSTEDRRVTTAEAAAAAGCAVGTIRTWAADGKLKRYGEGRAVRYSLTEVLAVVPERSAGPTVEERAEAAFRRHHG